MSCRAKKYEEVAICLHLVMRRENILLATLVFLNLEMTGVVYYEARDPRLHRR